MNKRNASDVKVYVSAAFGEKVTAQNHARMLEQSGFQVVSTWHESTATGEVTDPIERKKHLATDLGQVAECDVLWFLNGGTPRCGFVEVGYAMSLGKRIVFSQREGGHNSIADAYENSVIHTGTNFYGPDNKSNVCVHDWMLEGYEHMVNPPLAPASLSTGRKDDTGKTRWTLFPWRAALEVMGVIMFGAKKYGDFNWKLVLKGEFGELRYIDAMFRHVIAYTLGEKNDKDTGKSHLAHAICCAMFLLEGAE